jgi:4-hydroxythreonine-4-phosphate dehydrogenase
MLISAKKLAVSPITTHIDVRHISKKLNSSLILNKIKTIDLWFKKFLKKKPKIAVLGLNPHNSEFKKNSEENKIIIPVIKKLRKSGVNLSGPFAADTLFVNNYKNYDVIVGMFHDQVLAPFKTLFKFNAINITLGLKYLRVSPDHGTASDIIGKNKANPKSLIDCIYFINKHGR